MNAVADVADGRASSWLAKAGRSFLALGFGNYGAVIISLVINALLAQRLGPDQYGRLALMLMVSQVLLLTAVNWSHAGFVRFGAQEFATKRAASEALWARLGIVLPAAGIGALIVAAGRHALADYLQIPASVVWLILVHFAATSMLSIAGAILQASDQMARYGVSLFLDKVLMLACLVALPAAWTSIPVVALGCYAVSSLSVAVWCASVVGARGLRPLNPSWSNYRAMLVFSVPLAFSSWAGFFGTNWFDLAILKWYVPVSSIGVYSLATQLAGVVQQVTVIFSTLLLPHLSVAVAERDDARIRMFLERLLPYWLLGTAVLFSLVLLAARVLVPLIFGEAFSGAVPILAVLMVATSALALFNACAPLATAFGSTWVVSAICFVSAAANVVLDLLLIPSWGVLGSAAATVLAYGTAAALVLIFVKRRTATRLMRLGWLTGPVVAASVCFLAFDGIWFYAAALVSIALTIIALISAFRLFQADDVVFLKQLRPTIG